MATAKSRPAGAKLPDYNVYLRDCPARMVFDRMANKWSLLVLRRLQDEPLRFNQLRREIEGVTQKVLTQTLRKLERDGLIERTVFPSVPVRVEYALSPLGRELATLVEPLAQWAQDNIGRVEKARRQHLEDGSGHFSA